MNLPGWVILLLVLASPGAMSAPGYNPPDHLPRFAVTIEHGLPIPTRSPMRNGPDRPDRVTADLYRPNRADRMPAAIIVNSSGGVDSQSELVWAGLLSELGIATLVVDSFSPRGIRRTSRDQSQLDQFYSSQDGAAAARWLMTQPFVDPSRVLILGMSRGGSAAIANAVLQQRRQMRAEDVRFAAHVAISPGCGTQQRDARTTGAPILFILAEHDDYTPIGPCLDYARRLRGTGNGGIRLAVYPGVFHAPETPWGASWGTEIENGSACNLLREDGGAAFTDMARGIRIAPRDQRDHVRATCLTQGATVGGDLRVRAQIAADLVQFLQETGFVEDPAMLRLLPVCATLPGDRTLQMNCSRARGGWPGDAVSLALSLRRGTPAMPADRARGAALLRLTAERGHPWAMLELGLVLRVDSPDAPRDLSEAQRLLKASADAGFVPAFNGLGLLLRDAPTPFRDESAARIWFQRGAEAFHRFAMSNLGRLLETGRGGPADPAAARRWYEAAALREEPWGQLYLAGMQERGEGGLQDRAAALANYRAAGAQDFPARDRAQDGERRLGAN